MYQFDFVGIAIIFASHRHDKIYEGQNFAKKIIYVLFTFNTRSDWDLYFPVLNLYKKIYVLKISTYLTTYHISIPYPII